MNTDRWSGPIPVEEVVYKAVLELNRCRSNLRLYNQRCKNSHFKKLS